MSDPLNFRQKRQLAKEQKALNPATTCLDTNSFNGVLCAKPKGHSGVHQVIFTFTVGFMDFIKYCTWTPEGKAVSAANDIYDMDFNFIDASSMYEMSVRWKEHFREGQKGRRS